jgi:hypothetical protein
MAKKIHGKQLLDNTIVKTINGVTYSHQGITSSNDSNVTLSIVSGQTHSFNLGWTGVLPVSRGGLSNSTFTASQILIIDSMTSSVISSGYLFNDAGTSAFDVWSANKIISYTSMISGSGLSASLAVGNNAGTYSIDMNQNKIMNVATGSNRLDATNYGQMYDMSVEMLKIISLRV